MQASVIIPVWNGETVIEACLKAVYAHSGQMLLEVICVDNASSDNSARLIATHYPQARLLCQPVNLGFAGGVNVGLQTAQGDLLVLLNQDCMVEAGWLEALVQTFSDFPHFGIAGGTILNGDGTINHAGAELQRPLAYGRHLTEVGQLEPRPVDYVTGAIFAITRAAWEVIGPFDEGFYPAYFEETDFCYRARRRGLEIGYAPGARGKHLFNNKEWQRDPIRHTANQHAMRYRFVSKHYTGEQMADFFTAEAEAIAQEIYYEQAVGRVLGARQTVRQLSEIVESRQRDLSETADAAHQRHLSVGFTQLLHHAFAVAEKLSLLRGMEPPTLLDDAWRATTDRLQALQQQEHDLLARIYFRKPGDTRPEATWRRLWRLLLLRPLSFLIGRDYLLLSQLNSVHVARLDQMAKMQHLIEQQLKLLNLLKTLSEYDHR